MQKQGCKEMFRSSRERRNCANLIVLVIVILLEEHTLACGGAIALSLVGEVLEVHRVGGGGVIDLMVHVGEGYDASMELV